MSVSSVVPTLILALWLLRGLSEAWRRALWEDGCLWLADVADAVGGEIEPIWGGYRMRSDGGFVTPQSKSADATRAPLPGQGEARHLHVHGGWPDAV